MILSVVASTIPALRAAPVPASAAPATAAKPRPIAALADLPLQFVPNVGQFAFSAPFVAEAAQARIAFQPGAVQYTLAVPPDLPKHHAKQRPQERRQDEQRHREQTVNVDVTARFLDADLTHPLTPTERLPGIVNYSTPTTVITNVPTYAGVRYPAIYPGIDLQFDGTGGTLKSTWTVAPGADPGQIRWNYSSVKQIKVDSDGNLVLTLPKVAGRAKQRILLETAPIAWQDIDNERVPVDVRYAVRGKAVSFAVGAYDPTQPLIIDPTLVYDTKLYGGTDGASDLAVDAADSIYLAGSTDWHDGFVGKVAANGTSREWTTYFSPVNYSAYVGAVAYDPTYGLYVSGSKDWNTGFLARLDPATGAVLWDHALALNGTLGSLKIDAMGALYGTDYDQLLKFDSTGTLQYSLTIPGKTLQAVALDANDHPYVVGFINGNNGLPADLYIAALTPAGSITTSEIIGGSDDDYAGDIAVDAQGMVYVTGATRSADFPLVNPVQATYDNATCDQFFCDDAFVLKLNLASHTTLFSTFLGGRGMDYGTSIAVDDQGTIYVAGSSELDDGAGQATFPLVQPIAGSDGQRGDSFVVKLTDVSGINQYSFAYSTVLGDPWYDTGSALTLHNGNVYVAGSSSSYDSGDSSAYVARIADTAPPQPGGDVVNINFQPPNTSVPFGYLPDAGLEFGKRGNNWSYGWVPYGTNDGPYVVARHYDEVADQRYDTAVFGDRATDEVVRWEIELPESGRYSVRIVAGTPPSDVIPYWLQMYAEGVPVISSRREPDASQYWVEGIKTVQVDDGRFTLTIRAPHYASFVKWGLAFLEISHATAANAQPVVELTAPGNLAMVYADRPVTLHAAAHDNDGQITSVRFYANGTLLGEDTTAPYSWNWGCPTYGVPCTPGVAAGTYTITAEATDNSRATTLSAPVRVSVVRPTLARNRTEFAVELKIFLPYETAPIPFHPLYTGIVAKGDDRTWSSTSQRYRIAQHVTMIPVSANDRDGRVDGVLANSFVNLVNTSVNYDEASSVNPETLRLTEAAKNEPLTEANKSIPWMVDYGIIPQDTLDRRMRMTPLAVTSPYTKAVRLYGEASDPIIHPDALTCDIDWDLRITIEQPIASSSPPRVKVSGTHEDFPAYELYIDGQPVYQWFPPPENDVLNLCRFKPATIDVNTGWMFLQ